MRSFLSVSILSICQIKSLMSLCPGKGPGALCFFQALNVGSAAVSMSITHTQSDEKVFYVNLIAHHQQQ